jgi:hypothetical protein
MHTLSIEGRIRDLGLAEVFQLLSRGRKSGTLHCDAPLLSRGARVAFVAGAIVEARVTALGGWTDDERGEAEASAEAPRATTEAVLDVLCWRDGTFRFSPAEQGDAPCPRRTLVRLAVEPLLIEAAQRAIVWDRIESRVPHARVIPAFSDLEPGELPQLRLTPPQWELLTHVDGACDLAALASVMKREIPEVAELVHDLIEARLLTLREAPVAPRRNPTPPTNASLPFLSGSDASTADLWVPDRFSGASIRMPGDQQVDSVFDPVAVGVLTPEGLPSLAPPPDPVHEAVAPLVAGPSLSREQAAASDLVMPTMSDGPALCRQGDALLRTGDLLGAVAYWDAALRATIPVDDAERLRDVIELATRLHALVP